MTRITLTIIGEPASKANQRKLATVGPADKRRTLFIKSGKARDYEHDALRQIPKDARQRLEGPVKVTMTIFYASERPDLDESLILDVLQDRFAKKPTGPAKVRSLVQAGVYRNDRQVREKHIIWGGVDKRNPRAEITVESFQPQQAALVLAPSETPNEVFFA